MREMTFDQVVAAWEKRPEIPRGALYQPGGTVRVGDFILPLPPRPDPMCSPEGLASLFVGLGGGRQR